MKQMLPANIFGLVPIIVQNQSWLLLWHVGGVPKREKQYWPIKIYWVDNNNHKTWAFAYCAAIKVTPYIIVSKLVHWACTTKDSIHF